MIFEIASKEGGASQPTEGIVSNSERGMLTGYLFRMLFHVQRIRKILCLCEWAQLHQITDSCKGFL